MPDSEIDLLTINRGTVTAPAGCGKTHLIADALMRYDAIKPILTLTHTNAGVAALRGRLDEAGVPSRVYRLATIDGWAMRLISMFPARSKVDTAVLRLDNPGKDYPAIRSAAWTLLSDGHVAEVLSANFSRLVVDEYQDCNFTQHALVTWIAQTLPTCVLGDPMQAIFGWQDAKMPDWDTDVCGYFPLAGELNKPWRWTNAGTEKFGRWLLDVRHALRDGRSVDLRTAPPEVSWVNLDGSEDRVRQIRAASVRPIDKDGSVLIIGNSKSPRSQRDFAAQIRGAVTVESVDLRDTVNFARRLDFRRSDSLSQVIEFAADVMTNVGAADFMKRVDILERGTAANRLRRQNRPGCASRRRHRQLTPSLSCQSFPGKVAWTLIVRQSSGRPFLPCSPATPATPRRFSNLLFELGSRTVFSVALCRSGQLEARSCSRAWKRIHP